MDKIAEFINGVQTIDVSLEKRYLVKNMYPLKEEDVPKEKRKHIKSKKLYVVNKCSEGTIRTLYNKAKFSLASLSDKELENTLKLLKDYGYEHFDKAYRTYYMKLTNGEAHPKHDTYFMLALQDRLKNDVPHFGVFTMEFLHDLHDDVLIKRGYMYSLTQDVKKMMGENDKKITLQSTTAITSLQSESHSPHPKTASSINNNDKPINYNPMDINFEAIFEVALNYADDPEEMKEFCMREQRKAEKEHEYIDKSFYKGLLKVVADKKERAKYQPKPGPTPTHIGSFFIAGGGGSGYDYKSIELLEQIIEELRDEGSVQRIEQTNKDKHENNATLSSKIKPLFNFIDFLHANIENINQNMKIVLEWKKARWQERQFRQTYSDKLKMREVQKVIKAKWNQLSEQLIKPISEKAIEIDVCVLDNPKSIYTNFSHHMVMLQENFHEEDVDEIMKVKKQYIEIRNDINLHIILLLKDFFKYFDELMKHLVRFFYEDGDRTIPRIVDIYLDDYFRTPKSFELPLSDSQVKDFYDSLLIEHQEVICEDTDFDYFSYAISGKEIPLKKTPYKPVVLAGTIDSMYYELFNLMKKCGEIPEKRKTIPQKYVMLAESLFLNRNMNPLKLRTPK